MNIETKKMDYIEFQNKYSNYNDKELIYNIYLEKNVKIKFEIFYIDFMSTKCKYRSDLIEELWKEKTKFYKELNIIMLKELKKDFIEKYGIIKYLVEEYIIKEDFIKIINKQKEMLLLWNE
jgi:hypothetical protein